jgi:exopolysaccharide biosynthesis protein
MPLSDSRSVIRTGVMNIACGLVTAAAMGLCAGAATVTNQPATEILWRAETRVNPPQRLFIAEVDLRNPWLHLRVAPGGPDPDGPGPWETTLLEPTKIASREQFALVVNGDFFVAKGVNDAEGAKAHFRANQWASTEGPAMTDGRTWSTSTNMRPCLVVQRNGAVTIAALSQPGGDDWEVVGGGPQLVHDGIALPVTGNFAVRHRSKIRNPRTAVGLDATGTRLTILVVDGRKPRVALGMTYSELAAEMVRLGCREALNLDGGGSSLLAVKDPKSGRMRILNNPSDGRERAVANVLGVSLDD